MPNRHRILIVDDDHDLREALTEQLSLYEEFEAVAAYRVQPVPRNPDDKSAPAPAPAQRTAMRQSCP
jgi:hypothetical protein